MRCGCRALCPASNAKGAISAAPRFASSAIQLLLLLLLPIATSLLLLREDLTFFRNRINFDDSFKSKDVLKTKRIPGGLNLDPTYSQRGIQSLLLRH
jgi:hypothetical protein